MSDNVPEILTDNGLITDDKKIAEAFNYYYINISQQLEKNIPKVKDNHSKFMPRKLQHSMYLDPVREGEILKIVKMFKNKKSSGHDGISMINVKKLIQSLELPLRHIFNLSMFNGVVPQAFKKAKVIPIYKSGPKNILNNYRPLSLLPQFWKILEKLVYSRLILFLDVR